MLARAFFTGVALLLAVGGFFGAAPPEAGPLNPFGILFLAFSGVIWLGWDVVRDAWRDRVDLMAVRASLLVRQRYGDRANPTPPPEPRRQPARRNRQP